MKGLIGKKLGMTQVFSPDGTVVPVTVLDVTPSTVLQVKTVSRDGYEALQLGYGGTRLHRVSRANQARAVAAGLEQAPVRVREFRTTDADRFKVGDVVGVDFFHPGDRVKVVGTSKGRGFTGVMKRYGFGGGTRKSHGGGPAHRGAGSVGSSADPSRTMKGRRLHGQYGNRRSTVLNLLVVGVDAEQGVMLVRGAVPGSVNGLVLIELLDREPRSYTPMRSTQPAEAEPAPAESLHETTEPPATTSDQDTEGEDPGQDDHGKS